jgi:hypothetical protein
MSNNKRRFPGDSEFHFGWLLAILFRRATRRRAASTLAAWLTYARRLAGTGPGGPHSATHDRPRQIGTTGKISLATSGKSVVLIRPSHPRRGGSRVVTNCAVGCDGRDSVGRARDRRAGSPVSNRPACGRTMLPTVFVRTLPGRESRRDFWRKWARTAKSCWPGAPIWRQVLGDASGPTGFGCIVNPGATGAKELGTPGRARSKP